MKRGAEGDAALCVPASALAKLDAAEAAALWAAQMEKPQTWADGAFIQVRCDLVSVAKGSLGQPLRPSLPQLLRCAPHLCATAAQAAAAAVGIDIAAFDDTNREVSAPSQRASSCALLSPPYLLRL